MKINFRSKIFALIIFLVACSKSSVDSPVELITLESSPVPSPNSTSTHIARPTYQPRPTLSFDLQDQFYDLLKTNGNCELPCLLGIVPGRTSWDEANRILEKFAAGYKPIMPDKFASNSDYAVRNVAIVTTKDVSLNMYITLAADNKDIIQYMIYRLDVISKDGFTIQDEKRLLKYSPLETLKQQGVPDVVYVSVHMHQDAVVYIVYEHRKIVEFFTGVVKSGEDESYEMCPESASNYSPETALASSSDPVDVKKLFEHPFYEGVPNVIEVFKLSNTNIQNFYDVILQDQSGCFTAT